ncbi:hypothetical protein ACS0TY_021061 [Phlomoides rotata]
MYDVSTIKVLIGFDHMPTGGHKLMCPPRIISVPLTYLSLTVFAPLFPHHDRDCAAAPALHAQPRTPAPLHTTPPTPSPLPCPVPLAPSTVRPRASARCPAAINTPLLPADARTPPSPENRFGLMEDHCTTFANLKPYVQSWFVKALVAEKTAIRSLKWGRQQRLVLIDKENQRMQCIIYEQDVDRLNSVLHLYGTYVIGNGKIKEMSASTPTMGDSKYQIILSRSAYIKATSKHEELPLDHVYQLTPFVDCPQFVDFTNRHINLLCGVIHVFPSRYIQKIQKTVQEFVVVNEESRPTILTLWEEFIQSEGLQLSENIHRMPIILGMRLSVNNYHGISFGTLPISTILIDPPISQAKNLDSWLKANREYVERIVPQKLYEKENQITNKPLDSQIRKISQILCLPETIKSTLQVIKPGQQFYFLGCPGCSKACGAVYGSEFTCFYCNTDFPNPKPMLRFEAELYDGTGCLDAFAEHTEAQTLLHMSAEDVITAAKNIKHRDEREKIYTAHNHDMSSSFRTTFHITNLSRDRFLSEHTKKVNVGCIHVRKSTKYFHSSRRPPPSEYSRSFNWQKKSLTRQTKLIYLHCMFCVPFNVFCIPFKVLVIVHRFYLIKADNKPHFCKV